MFVFEFITFHSDFRMKTTLLPTGEFPFKS
jgi:hypothetical protein